MTHYGRRQPGIVVMKHFPLEGDPLAPFAELGNLVEEHHTILVKDGLPAGQPVLREGKTRCSRISEFDPALRQGFLADWFGESGRYRASAE